jgi:small subunit ribosomal protein S21|tara:strand:+ start:184 stop:369 length:186 start_codon:yes stop_codon:yes gene_type:complete
MLIIEVDKGNIEKALKQYKRKVRNTKQINHLRDQQDFTKPSAKKRLKMQKAKYLQSKNQPE